MTLGKKTYVMHCEKCRTMVEIDDRYGPCPGEKDHTEFNERLARGEVALPFIPDYKKGENYPQRAINLKGEPWVTSYEDYKMKCRAAGQVETGVSNEARYRAKHKGSRKKRMRFDPNARRAAQKLDHKIRTEKSKPENWTIREPGKKPVAL